MAASCGQALQTNEAHSHALLFLSLCLSCDLLNLLAEVRLWTEYAVNWLSTPSLRMSSRTHCGNQKINQSARETQKWPLQRANSSFPFLSAASSRIYLRTQLVEWRGRGRLCSVLLPLCLFGLCSSLKRGKKGKLYEESPL